MIQHGTNAGHAAHRSRGEKPCDPCRLAHNKEVSRTNAAVGRAQRALAKRYPEEFRELYQKELEKGNK